MKRKNQKVSAWYILLLLSVIVYACVDDNTNTPEPDISEVKFSVSLPADEGGRADNNVADVRYVVFSVTSDNGDTPYEFEQLELLSFDGDYISEPFSLEVGDYELTDFLLLDDNGDVLFATPKTGSAYAKLVNSPLSIDFEVTKDAVTKLTPEVVSAAESTAADFGYAAFGFEVAEFFSLPITVMVYDPDVENYVLVTADLTIEADSTIILEEELDAATNEVRVKDESHDSYTLTVAKDGYDDFNYTYSADSLRGYEGNDPLIVVLQSEFDYEGTLYGIGWNSDSTGLVFGTLSYDGTETIIRELDLNGDVASGFSQGSSKFIGDYYCIIYRGSEGLIFVAIDKDGNVALQLNRNDYEMDLSSLIYSTTDDVFYGIIEAKDSTMYFGSLDMNGNVTEIKELYKGGFPNNKEIEISEDDQYYGFIVSDKSWKDSLMIFDNLGNSKTSFPIKSGDDVTIGLEYDEEKSLFYGLKVDTKNGMNSFGTLDLVGNSTIINPDLDFIHVAHSDYDKQNNLYIATTNSNGTSLRFIDTSNGVEVGRISQGILIQQTLQLND